MTSLHTTKPLSSGEAKIKAIIRIQTWYRRYKARLEARRRAAWVVYQTIEYSSENKLNDLQKFFDDVLYLGAELDGGCSKFAKRLQERDSDATRKEQELLSRTKVDDVEVEKSFAGLRLTFPLTAPQVQAMMEYFSNGGQLHARYLLQLLHEIRLALKERNNIYQPSTSISRQVTVVGDLHGQLDDLLLIFYKNGLPDVTNPYVFNGDIVDRGPNSVEVAVLLFACQLVWPTAVCINRGNHEDFEINCQFGFIDEVAIKYPEPRTLEKILYLFNDAFMWLPLATIIDESIFVAHGGISDKLDLKLLGRLNRHKYYSSLRQPRIDNGSDEKMEWEQVTDLLWSDPQPKLGFRFNEVRNVGCLFGPDATADFLKRNKLKMLVRSHECKSDGYEFDHGGCMLTIFSASNYYSDGSNLGAYVKFDNNGQPSIVQFCSSKANLLPLGRRLLKVEDGALRSLRAQIAANKTELLTAFSRVIPRLPATCRKDYVSVSQWCGVMKSVLNLCLPWRLLLPHLAQMFSDDLVLYKSTFERADIEHHIQNSQPAPLPDVSMMEAVYKNKEELEIIFRIMDRDNSGSISLDEFKECCRVLGRATKRYIPESDIIDMVKAMDLNNDGKIDFNEFLESFRIVESQSTRRPTRSKFRGKR